MKDLKSMSIGPTGIWDLEIGAEHMYDAPLCAAIINLFNEHEVMTVLDLGCGSGNYVAALNGDDFVAAGLDGNLNTWKFNADCHVQDLSSSFSNGKYDAVLSLEVGEHIPRQYESVFLDNVASHALKVVVLSWFPEPGHGLGHVNERGNEYIIGQMVQRGFYHMPAASGRLREAATLWWFKSSLMAFSK